MPIRAHSARSMTRSLSPPSRAISPARRARKVGVTTLAGSFTRSRVRHVASAQICPRSEEHTSELQSQSNLVCRLLLEKKKQNYKSQGSQQKKKKDTIRL